MSRLADRAKSYPLASFGAALLPPELGGPLPAQFVQRVDRYVTRLPATSRFAVRAGLASLAAASYLTTGRSLPRLHPDERARVLHRIAALSPEVAAAVEGLKAIVLLANGADTYAHELLARAQEHDAARPDAELTVILSADSPSVTRADAVVVGSGAGGAMVARTLARAGLDVVVLEEGRRWTVEEFRSTHPVDRYAGLYRGAGATVALGRPAVVLPMGRAVGGTTVVNSGTCFRPSLAVQRRWRDEFGLGLADPDQLGRRLDDAEQTLRVAPVPLEIMGRNGRLLLQAAKSLGWRAAPTRAMRRGAVAVASARSAAPATPSSACTSTPCRKPARPARGSSPGRGSNGSCTAPGGPMACEPAGPTAPHSTCWPTRSSSPPVRRRRQDCCGAAVLVGTRDWATTLRCTRQLCWPGSSTTTSSRGAGCCRARRFTSFTNPTAC